MGPVEEALIESFLTELLKDEEVSGRSRKLLTLSANRVRMGIPNPQQRYRIAINH